LAIIFIIFVSVLSTEATRGIETLSVADLRHETGTLKVTGFPDGAEVYIDGIFKGRIRGRTKEAECAGGVRYAWQRGGMVSGLVW
jgi:hypothetical protein